MVRGRSQTRKVSAVIPRAADSDAISFQLRACCSSTPAIADGTNMHAGYAWGTTKEKAEAQDLVIESQGIRLFVDEFSAQYLNGVTVDFKSNFQESGFAFENPNATGGCGCGSSFTV